MSLLLAARNEEADIGDCVRSVLQSSYGNFELIVIDDRSSDGTLAAVESAAAGDPRVRVLRVAELPPGWTGKMNAVRRGLDEADGDLVLIIDADSRHTPHTLGAAVARMQSKRVALLSLLPRLEYRGFLSHLVQPVVGATIVFWRPLPLVNSSKHKDTALGWGGFLLMDRDALRSVGGLEAVKGQFAADICLVRRFKQAGHRVRILHAPELVSTVAFSGPAAQVRGCSRQLRLSLDNRVLLLVLNLFMICLFCLSAYAAAAVGLVELLRGEGHQVRLALGMMGVVHLFFQLLLLGRVHRDSGNSPFYALAHLPSLVLTGLVTIVAILQSWAGSISWRGTSYQVAGNGRACA